VKPTREANVEEIKRMWHKIQLLPSLAHWRESTGLHSMHSIIS